VLVVVASSQDSVAAAVAARWAAGGAAVLTCRDLSVSGWCYRPGDGAGSIAVVAGRRVRAAEIEGVLMRLPGVGPHDLPHIVASDREYVAEEMSAFLTSWLSDLPCPMLNRPTPTCLAGPGWPWEQWVLVAAGLGLPVRPVRRRHTPRDRITTPAGAAPTGLPDDALTVTVVGRRCFGADDDHLAMHARRLAKAAGVDLLAVHFDRHAADARLLGADLWPDVSQPEIADTVAAYLRSARRAGPPA
jgi:hypothetical protein